MSRRDGDIFSFLHGAGGAGMKRVHIGDWDPNLRVVAGRVVLGLCGDLI